MAVPGDSAAAQQGTSLTLAVVLVAVATLAGCERRHPPPGSENAMAEVLLRDELGASHSHLGTRGQRCPCYVLVGEHDLSREGAMALGDTGVIFLPGSAWVRGKGLRVRIGKPRTRWNGNFDVDVNYDCGPAPCRESARWIMRYDGSRWRVIQRAG